MARCPRNTGRFVCPRPDVEPGGGVEARCRAIAQGDVDGPEILQELVDAAHP